MCVCLCENQLMCTAFFVSGCNYSQLFCLAVAWCCCSTFDPLAKVFEKGIRTSIVGVTAHYVSSLSGSVTFNCDIRDRNAYPGVFKAKRQVMQCEQDLSAYLRLPCPKDAKSCTVNYAEK